MVRGFFYGKNGKNGKMVDRKKNGKNGKNGKMVDYKKMVKMVKW